jgi:hypothetical protein
MDLCKQVDIIGSAIVQATTCEELEERIDNSISEIPEGGWTYGDISRCDSLANQYLGEIDYYFKRNVFPFVLRKLNIPSTIYQDVLDGLCSRFRKVSFFLPRAINKTMTNKDKSFRMATMLVDSTTFSGHALTTWTNTIHFILLVAYICDRHNIPYFGRRRAVIQFQAGDDMLFRVALAYKRRFLWAMGLYFMRDNGVGGFGQVVKKFESGQVIDFLSKHAIDSRHGVKLMRKIRRSLFTGQQSWKVTTHEQWTAMRQAVHGQLRSWIDDFTFGYNLLLNPFNKTAIGKAVVDPYSIEREGVSEFTYNDARWNRTLCDFACGTPIDRWFA